MATRHSGHRVSGLVVVLLAASGAAALGQELSEQAQRQIGAIYADKAGWTTAQRKLDTSLLYASRESQDQPMVQGMRTDQDLALLSRVASRAAVQSDGMVVVDIRAEVTDGLLEAIGDAGGKVLSAFPAFGAVRARIPIRRVEALAALAEVRKISPKQEVALNIGGATSEGDAAHRALAARTASGLDGTGVKIGVLSDGVDTLAARQSSSDLPATCAPIPGLGSCVQVVQECDLTGTPPGTTCGAEGTAMMEIVHDLAPGAKLYFATALDSDAAFAANILALKNTYGCDVIVDDITYLNEGAFQDGVIAQAVTTVKNAGALYFSSAGNSGRKDGATGSGTWEGDWVNSGHALSIPAIGYPPRPMHSFNGLSGTSAATSDQLTAGSGPISLKWSDPLGHSTNDYDLFRVNSAFTTLLDFSADSQTGAQDPLEAVGPANSGDKVVILLYSGAARALRLDTNRGRLSISTPRAVVGHNGGESTISVAAANVASAGGGAFTGGSANPVEAYSSDGPRRLFYYPNGTAITPGNVLFGTGGGRDLKKPDITAADCVTTTTPDFAPFCGTSAAAPHAAAIAGLLKSAANGPGAGQVLAAMFATALDVTPPTGWDRNAGVGIVMADTALDALTTVPPIDFYTVSPCRVVDTRQTGGALSCGTERALTMVGGTCGVPTGAKAVSLNVTVTGSSATGNVRVYAAGAPAPSASTINYVAGQTRANNAVAPLSTAGQIAVLCSPTGTAHVIVDVNGYFK